MTGSDTEIETDTISDDELEALALAAEPDPIIDPDAEPWHAVEPVAGLLPDWYMPGPVAVRRDLKTRVVAASIIGSIVAINAAGLCVTYGRVVFG